PALLLPALVALEPASSLPLGAELFEPHAAAPAQPSKASAIIGRDTRGKRVGVRTLAARSSD
ncbi:MAG TPA: hypothetical protein VGM44_18110, partial [Polyangiaceae bacterium]